MKMSPEDKRVQNTASSPRRWWEMGPRFHRSCGLCGARPAMSGHSTLRSGCSLVPGLSQRSSCTLAQHSRVLICPPGGQLTWGPTGPGCQRHSGVARHARPTGEKEDFDTEGLPSPLLNNEWDLRLPVVNSQCSLYFSLVSKQLKVKLLMTPEAEGPHKNPKPWRDHCHRRWHS